MYVTWLDIGDTLQRNKDYLVITFCRKGQSSVG